ncbi:MAG: ROK family protein [Nitriliruptorales bacterium]|nr:ROK family protein [Nitriliruptorales bacterium]
MVTVGIDLGGTNVQVVVMAEDDSRVGWSKMKIPLQGDRNSVLEVLEAAVHEATDDAGVDLDDVSGVGLGTPGVVIGGTVGGATNVPGWYERFSLAEVFSNQVGRPVRIANDVTAAAVAEHRLGAGRGCDHVLVVFAGTGVGAGLVLNGQPYEGAVGGAGEFGHTVIERGGAVCPCGRRGCIEAYAGRRAMAQAAERAVAAGRSTILFDIQDEQGKKRPTSGVFHEAYARGDELVADLLDDATSALGVGIASAVNLLDVEVVVLGGGLADKLGERFLTTVDAAMRPHLFLQPPRVRLVSAELGDETGALGAALLARDA